MVNSKTEESVEPSEWHAEHSFDGQTAPTTDADKVLNVHLSAGWGFALNATPGNNKIISSLLSAQMSTLTFNWQELDLHTFVTFSMI